MCGVAAAIGIGSAILGIASQYMAYQQAIADTEFYNAQRNLEWQSATLQAESNRATENVRGVMNDNYQNQVRDLADLAFESESTGITVFQQQEQIKAAQEKREATIESWKVKGKIKAGGRIGLTADSLLNDVERQIGVFDFLSGQNLGFAFQRGQYERKVGQAARGSRIASAREYVKTTYLDPVKPLEKSRPSFGPYALGMASSALGGFSSYAGIEQLRLDKGLNPGGWRLWT